SSFRLSLLLQLRVLRFIFLLKSRKVYIPKSQISLLSLVFVLRSRDCKESAQIYMFSNLSVPFNFKLDNTLLVISSLFRLEHLFKLTVVDFIPNKETSDSFLNPDRFIFLGAIQTQFSFCRFVHPFKFRLWIL